MSEAARTDALLEAEHVHTSILLGQLIANADGDTFTLGWLIAQLPRRSFGVIMLFLALVSLLPVISVVSRLLFVVLAGQIVLGYTAPRLPQRLLGKPLPARFLKRLDRHAIPALRYLERKVHPRWPLLLLMRRLVAIVAMLLTILSLLLPIPLANVPPAAICALMALAYIEHDGMLLTVALFSALTMLGLAAMFFL